MEFGKHLAVHYLSDSHGLTANVYFTVKNYARIHRIAENNLELGEPTRELNAKKVHTDLKLQTQIH